MATRTKHVFARRLIVALGALAVAVLAAPRWLAAVGHWLAMPAGTGGGAVIVVNGGTRARTERGIALYHLGLAPELWHTSYARNQALVNADVVERGHIPSRAFQFLPSLNTWTDGGAVAAGIRARGLTRIVLVTDWWHSRRALCSLHGQLAGYPVVIAYAPAPSPAGPDDWWRDGPTRARVLRELVALPFYAVRYGMPLWGCR